MKNILILGLGEIGTSLLRLYTSLTTFKEVYNIYYIDVKEVKGVKDITSLNDVKEDITIDVLHVSIPFNDLYLDTVVNTIKRWDVQNVLNHSTVDIGTTREVFNQTGVNIVHTPVMGLHPDLTNSIRTFRKIVGAVNEEAERFAVEHLNSLGVTCEIYSSPESAEAGKLWSTTYFANLVRFIQDAQEYCEKNKVPLEEVYKLTNEIYNEGYEKLGFDNVKRPILKYHGRGIGGHCLFENAVIIDQKNNLPVIKMIINEGKNELKSGLTSRIK
jgi:UDP-glucose 6-dehydrogenase